MARDEVKWSMRQMTGQIGKYAGILASNYATVSSEIIIETWAQIVIDGLTDNSFGFDELEDATKDRKRIAVNKGEALEDFVDTPLIETGRLLGAIEFSITPQLGKNYDILEMSVRNDSVTGHGKDTLYDIALMHEYGIGVPSRPIFERSALELGYRKDRIFKTELDKARSKIAQGYARTTAKSKEKKGVEINDLEKAAADAYRSTHKSTPRTGRIHQVGATWKFGWDKE